MGENTLKLLEEKLDPANIKTRKQAGKTLSYIEGYLAEKNANKVFGYEWDKELISMTELFVRGYKTEEKEMHEVAYKATVRVRTLISGKSVFRDGTGFGNGQSSNLSGAYELAIKEAETDAMKRALKSFGNQFGIELYDKGYNANENYVDGVMMSIDLVEARESLDKCTTRVEIREIYKNYDGAYRKEFEKMCMERKKSLNENT